MLRLLILVLGLTICTANADAASGIKGHVTWRGEVFSGIKVRAFRSVADIAAGKAVAVSTPSKPDGTYLLELPPGNYYLTASDFDHQPLPGKFFCYFNGAPVQVREGAYADVGFNMIRIPKEAPPVTSQYSGIQGEISFQGKPLEHSYLYIYKTGEDGFKGPGYIIQPVEKGTFRLRLPPGEYYLLARKRIKGGQFGPIETGDFFNYYYGNPLRIEAGKVREIKLETVSKQVTLDSSTPFHGIRGVILGPDKKPVPGLRVFAYRHPEMTGTPDYFSSPSAADGRFALSLPDNGPFYLLARAAFGGPAEEGELYGKFADNKDHAVSLPGRDAVREIRIHVEQLHRPSPR